MSTNIERDRGENGFMDREGMSDAMERGGGGDKGWY